MPCIKFGRLQKLASSRSLSYGCPVLPSCKRKVCALGCSTHTSMLHGVDVLPGEPVY